jgi:hypothetical protein
MRSHTLRTQALSHHLDHPPPAQILAFLFRPPINTVPRAPFLLLNHTHRLLPPPPRRMLRLRTHYHNPMLHLRALSYLLPPNLRRPPHTCRRISRHRTPRSLYRRPLLRCLNTAQLMHTRPHPLSPCRPSLYRNPQLTLSPSIPPPSPLPPSRIYRTPTCLDATRAPFLFHWALLNRHAPVQTEDRRRQIRPWRQRRRRQRAAAARSEVEGWLRMKTSVRHASCSVGKRRARVRVVSRRRRTKSWLGPSIWNLTWAAAPAPARRMDLATPRTRNCRLSLRELYETHLVSGSRWAMLEPKVARSERSSSLWRTVTVLLIY